MLSDGAGLLQRREFYHASGAVSHDKTLCHGAVCVPARERDKETELGRQCSTQYPLLPHSTVWLLLERKIR